MANCNPEIELAQALSLLSVSESGGASGTPARNSTFSLWDVFCLSRVRQKLQLRKKLKEQKRKELEIIRKIRASCRRNKKLLRLRGERYFRFLVNEQSDNRKITLAQLSEGRVGLSISLDANSKDAKDKDGVTCLTCKRPRPHRCATFPITASFCRCGFTSNICPPTKKEETVQADEHDVLVHVLIQGTESEDDDATNGGEESS